MGQFERYIVVLVAKEKVVQQHRRFPRPFAQPLVVGCCPKEVHLVRWLVSVVFQYAQTNSLVLRQKKIVHPYGKLVLHRNTLTGQVVKVAPSAVNAAAAAAA